MINWNLLIWIISTNFLQKIKEDKIGLNFKIIYFFGTEKEKKEEECKFGLAWKKSTQVLTPFLAAARWAAAGFHPFFWQNELQEILVNK